MLTLPTTHPSAPSDKYLAGGEAFHSMLSDVDVDGQLKSLTQSLKETKSIAKRDSILKQIKYLNGLKRIGERPEDAFILNYMPVLPPICRPPIQKPGNRTEYADVNQLYVDHITANAQFNALKDRLDDDALVAHREALYKGAKAIVGLGEGITGKSKGETLKGLLLQISGTTGPKTGLFQSKILSKKQDFSARATIYAEPNLGFNEMAVPEDMLWTLYEFHIIRDMAKNGYTYAQAKEAVKLRNLPARASFNKILKMVPIIANRAPTLMQSNITAHFAVPIKGKTLGVNPLHLPLYAGDFDGDAMTIHVPITPEAVEEAKQKLLPEHHIYDYRKGQNSSLIAPGHEAILGSMYMTEPDHTKEIREFKDEAAVRQAFLDKQIDINTPIRITG